MKESFGPFEAGKVPSRASMAAATADTWCVDRNGYDFSLALQLQAERGGERSHIVGIAEEIGIHNHGNRTDWWAVVANARSADVLSCPPAFLLFTR